MTAKKKPKSREESFYSRWQKVIKQIPLSRRYCRRCGATLTTADREGNRCTQCQTPLSEGGSDGNN